MGKDIVSRFPGPDNVEEKRNGILSRPISKREIGLPHSKLIEGALVMNIVGSGEHHHMTRTSLTGCIPLIKSS